MSIFITYNDSNLCSFSMTVYSGSSSDDIPGTAHFLEHVLVRSGTKDMKAIRKELLDNYYLFLNGRTSTSNTEYRIDTHLYDLHSLDKILQNFGYNLERMKRFYETRDTNIKRSHLKKDIEHERKIIINESNEYSKDFILELNEILYGLSKIVGEEEDIKSITLEDLAEYYYKNYTKSNVDIFLSLPKKSKKIEPLFRQKLSSLILNNLSDEEEPKKEKLELNKNLPEIFYPNDYSCDSLVFLFKLPKSDDVMKKLDIDYISSQYLLNYYRSFLTDELFEMLVEKSGVCYSINDLDFLGTSYCDYNVIDIPTNSPDVVIKEFKKVVNNLRINESKIIQQKYFRDLYRARSNEDELFNRASNMMKRCKKMTNIEYSEALMNYEPSVELVNSFLRKFNKKILDSIKIMRIQQK